MKTICINTKILEKTRGIVLKTEQFKILKNVLLYEHMIKNIVKKELLK